MNLEEGISYKNWENQLEFLKIQFKYQEPETSFANIMLLS